MIPILDDGSVLPSVLGLVDFGGYSDLGNQNNLALRQGEVIDIIFPDDKRSVTKTYVEYRVSVQQKDGGETGATVEYPNCLVLNLFGGVADRLKFTLRADPAARSQVAGGLGSKVLILCVDGQGGRAYIIGGVPDGTATDSKDDGHNLLWEFNGIRAAISNKGEFRLEFKGATQADGKLAPGVDAANSGSTFIMHTNGDIEFVHAEQSFRIDHANKKIITGAHSGHEMVVTNGPGSFRASDEMYLEGKKGSSVNTDGTHTIRAANVKVGSDLAVDALVKGTTYRAAEAAMHTAIFAAFATMTTAIGAMASALLTAGASIGVAAAAHVVPVAGPIVGAAPLGVAAAAIGSCFGFCMTIAAAMSAIATAITTFESGAISYLSPKNTTD